LMVFFVFLSPFSGCTPFRITVFTGVVGDKLNLAGGADSRRRHYPNLDEVIKKAVEVIDPGIPERYVGAY